MIPEWLWNGGCFSETERQNEATLSIGLRVIPPSVLSVGGKCSLGMGEKESLSFHL